ncbi:hypothetical protein [Microbacterium sp. SSM24]|uniref:hypothetical protein n=1 Tax=Microbacterium sp. SSM24 TaxID=2991714 RepID=UPI0022275014|nr:hypothetical protein [Microbacterium sp. SSM24]MCW3493814.1 hypothetical protein [Microbacterium sp. SSM24]
MSAMPAVVFATPASLVEHGATARAAWSTVRRFVAAGTAALADRAHHRPAITHDEMARRRLVDRAIEAMRIGAYAEAALGGPRPR